MGRHPRPTNTPRHTRRRRQPRPRRHDLTRPARRRGRARARRRIRRGCRTGVPVRRRGRIGARAGPARGRPNRRADERRSVRPAGAVLGRNDGLRRVARRRRALPPRARRQLHHRPHRPDDRQRDRLEPRRQHDVPERQRHRLRRDVPLRRSDSGAITNRRTLVHSDQPGVVPDGLTVDEEDGIWVALWGGGAVNRYAPDGSLLASVELPVERPTSCAFGGPDAGDAVRHHRPGRDSTTTHWPGNPTAGACSRSPASAYAGSRASPTADDPPNRAHSMRTDRPAR